ncbi:hypothetical protein [Arthrobacter zhaoguopingii]|uniref:hypothetical protein n=1 Tax=Arthrobacter zhaoguopingii TaxID=2681491 RepID=UPI001357BE1B|nr:hypothetical protein [Arthrobacter zhaoguopingii]
MKHLTRLVVASGAGLVLAVTASPALAAPSDPGSNRAQVEHVEFSSPDGSFTYERRGVTRNADGHYTTNTREKTTIGQSSFDYKTHYTVTDKVTKLSSQNTVAENGETCRTNSQVVVVNGETRRENSGSGC